MIPTLTLFGTRVALADVDEQFSTGCIVMPESRAGSNYQLGRIVAAGPSTPFAKLGEIAFYQMPKMVSDATTYRYGQERVVVIQQTDILGYLSSPEVSIETFSVAGQWVLCSVEVEHGTTMVIPDTATSQLCDIHFTALQVGPGVQLEGLEPGGRVLIDRARATPFFLGMDRKEVVLVHKDCVLGIPQP